VPVTLEVILSSDVVMLPNMSVGDIQSIGSSLSGPLHITCAWLHFSHHWSRPYFHIAAFLDNESLMRTDAACRMTRTSLGTFVCEQTSVRTLAPPPPHANHRSMCGLKPEMHTAQITRQAVREIVYEKWGCRFARSMQEDRPKVRAPEGAHTHEESA